MPKSELPGRKAELAAAAYLDMKGILTLKQNFRTRRGEIDLVCLDKDVLVFVEVKSGGQTVMGAPALRVNRTKQKRLIAAATAYLAEHRPPDGGVRFDVISMLSTPRDEWQIEHIIDAFRPDDDL